MKVFFICFFFFIMCDNDDLIQCRTYLFEDFISCNSSLVILPSDNVDFALCSVHGITVYHHAMVKKNFLPLYKMHGWDFFFLPLSNSLISHITRNKTLFAQSTEELVYRIQFGCIPVRVQYTFMPDWLGSVQALIVWHCLI